MKSKVKGFTLIELIVVMAIFSIVLAAATSMMQPVAKIMVYTDLNASGNAQVSNISQYLENSLGTAEYIRTANFVPTDEDREKMVKYFVAQNYSGVLSKQTVMKDTSHDWVELSGLKYGKGKVHVMVIDNAQGGKISEYVYDVSFEPKPSIDDTAITQSSYTEFAVNKAFYDQFTYCVMPGDTVGSPLTFSFSTFMTDANSGKNSSFLIEAKTHRNGQDYTYSTTATVMLVNTMQSHRDEITHRPIGLYYVANKVADEDGHAPGTADYTETWGVVDQAESQAINAHVTPGAAAPVPIGPASIEGNTGFGNNTTTSVYPYRDGGMCFIYSYGAEMSTD